MFRTGVLAFDRLCWLFGGLATRLTALALQEKLSEEKTPATPVVFRTTFFQTRQSVFAQGSYVNITPPPQKKGRLQLIPN